MRQLYPLKFIALLFCVVTTSQVIFIGVINLIYDDGFVMTMRDLLKIPFISLTSVLPTIAYTMVKSKLQSSGAMTVLLMALHFTLTAGIVGGLLIYYGWMDATNAVFIVVFFIVIYVSAHIIQKLRDRKLAEQLNERINAFHNAKNETHRNMP